jgi:two-component system sensor histidine kinase RpfC
MRLVSRLTAHRRKGPFANIGLQRLRAILRRRPDTEHELTINRLILSSGIIVYLLVARALGSVAAAHALDVAALPVAIFELIAAGLFVHILIQPGVSHVRRLTGIVSDVGIFSYALHVCGEAGGALFLIYFWAVLGNGFRFGVTYMAIAAGAAIVGFCVVLLTTPYWQYQPSLSVGLLAGLVVIPAYTAKLIRKLSDAKREAEEASQAKSLFLASMSHELRTPLNAIIGLSDLLAGADIKGEQREMIGTIGRSGRSLLSLIESVLDFSRIEAGQVKMRSEMVDLPLLLRDVRDIVGVMAQAKGLRILLHIGPQMPRMVMTDRRHLEEILINLASNAVKFTERGHVRFDVDFSPSENGGSLRVGVTDTGIGIEQTAHTRIFERFTQADATIMDRFGGTGLGLAIVKQLVQALGGDINVSSVPGEGSTFAFHLPVDMPVAQPDRSVLPRLILVSRDADSGDMLDIAMRVGDTAAASNALASLRSSGVKRPIVLIDENLQPSPREVARSILADSGNDCEPVFVLLQQVPSTELLHPALRDLFVCGIDQTNLPALDVVAALSAFSVPVEADEAEVPPDGRQLVILIAEDNKINQMVLGKILEKAGHRYEIAGDGEAAVERMLQGGLDLVLMDVNMPVMNGIEATKFYHFAALGSTPVPIVAVTADATADAEERCLEAGMAACLTKPVDTAKLLATIAELVADIPVSATVRSAIEPDPLKLASQPVIDLATCTALERLGGATFVDDLLGQFVSESADAMVALADAVAHENVQEFRNFAHALRSSAANVGAMRVYQMCLEWRQINDRDLALQGERHLRALEEEFDLVRNEVDHRTRSAS